MNPNSIFFDRFARACLVIRGRVHSLTGLMGNKADSLLLAPYLSIRSDAVLQRVFERTILGLISVFFQCPTWRGASHH